MIGRVFRLLVLFREIDRLLEHVDCGFVDALLVKGPAQSIGDIGKFGHGAAGSLCEMKRKIGIAVGLEE